MPTLYWCTHQVLKATGVPAVPHGTWVQKFQGMQTLHGFLRRMDFTSILHKFVQTLIGL